jgi:hypothetical protein
MNLSRHRFDEDCEPPALTHRLDEGWESPALTHRLEYKVRVRYAQIFLWGSAGILTNATYPSMFLHVANDKHGEAVTLSTQAAATSSSAPPPPPTPLGTLKPGECYSISIQNIIGVCAACLLQQGVLSVETTVYCVISDH